MMGSLVKASTAALGYFFAKRHHRYLHQFKMLAGKGNANDGNSKQQPKNYMHQRRVQPAA